MDLHDHHDAILREWEDVLVREGFAALRGRDDRSRTLARVTSLLDVVDGPAEIARAHTGASHARAALELALLRDCIFARWERRGEPPPLAEVRRLDRALDRTLVTMLATEPATDVIDEEREVEEALGLLGSCLELEATLARASEVGLRWFADGCAIELEREGGGHSVAVTHVDASMLESVAALRGCLEPALLARVESGEQVHREVVCPDGRHAGSLLVAPLVAGRRALGSITWVRSRSRRPFELEERARAERLARMAAVAIENARRHERTCQTAELRDRLLRVASHDLRTPLTAIDLGAAVVLELTSGEPDGFLRRHLEMIRRNALRMARLLRDLTETSRIHAGRLTLERGAVAIVPILEAALATIEPVAREAHVTLAVELELGGDVVGWLDGERTQQAVVGLLSNAIRCAAPGGTVTLHAVLGGGEARVAVTDTGPGIAADELPHVFELFWQSRTDAGPGPGIALFLARGIVEAHGGHVSVESEVGRGTTVAVTLPLSARDASGP